MGILAALGFVFGAIVGSFLNVVVWRVPRGMSLVRPPSTCPRCGHRIRPWENIPILSWIFLGGRCSQCHQPISWKYPAGEAAVGALYSLVAMRVWQDGLPLSTLIPWFWFAGTILSLARIDWEHMVLPNLVNYSGMIFAPLCALVFPLSRPALVNPANPHYGPILSRRLVEALRNVPLPEWLSLRLASLGDCLLGMGLGFLLLAVVYFLGRKALRAMARRTGRQLPEEALGWGDVKMLAMTGAFLGADAVVILLAGGTLLGSLVGVLSAAFPRKGQSQALVWRQLPFAPFFAVPALLWVTLGNWFYWAMLPFLP
ncbi:MAG: prepilin peptidase [Oligosphaeraceae bacterium]